MPKPNDIRPDLTTGLVGRGAAADGFVSAAAVSCRSKRGCHKAADPCFTDVRVCAGDGQCFHRELKLCERTSEVRWDGAYRAPPRQRTVLERHRSGLPRIRLADRIKHSMVPNQTPPSFPVVLRRVAETLSEKGGSPFGGQAKSSENKYPERIRPFFRSSTGRGAGGTHWWRR